MKKIKNSEEEWRSELTPEEFPILREKGTERPFTGKHLHNEKKGIYVCRGCGNELFSSKTKFNLELVGLGFGPPFQRITLK